MTRFPRTSLRASVSSYGLTRNYRSVPAILNLGNRLAPRADIEDRGAPNSAHRAFFVPYKQGDRHKLITAFQAAALTAGLKIERSAAFCQTRELANKLAGHEGAPNQGTVKALAQAAILRD